MKLFLLVAALVFVYIATLLHTIIHEGGHLVFGLLTGYKFISFRVGSFMLKKEDKKLVFKRFTLAGTGGQCLMSPPELKNERMPYVMYNLGGALMNIVFSIITGVLMILTKDIELLFIFFFAMTTMGVIIGVTNGIPISFAGLDNDGKNIMSMSKEPFAIKAMWIQLKINEYTNMGVKLRDIPKELFELPDNVNMKNVLISSIAVFKCNRLMAERKFHEADMEMEKLLNSNAVIAGVYRSLLKLDRAYCEMINENRRDVVDKFFDKEVRNLMQTMKTFPSVIRTQYTYSLIVEKDINKANEYRDYLEKTAKGYPYSVDLEDERELMDHAFSIYESGELENSSKIN